MLLLKKKFNRDKLKNALISTEMNLRTLAKAINISEQKIIYILEAKNPKPSTILPICKWLKIDPKEFYI